MKARTKMLAKITHNASIGQILTFSGETMR
jgi:hypothetical protein